MSIPVSNKLSGPINSAAGQEIAAQRRLRVVLEQMVPGQTAGSNLADKNALLKPVQRINEALNPYNVQFELRDEDGRVITRVIDRESGEVIRQIPSEAVLQIADRLHELPGLLLQETG